MKHALDRVDELALELKSLLPMSDENRQRLDKKFRLEFNYNSNHMEGNTLTYGETELLLIFDNTKGNHSMREYEEMKAHDAAWRLVEEWAKETELPLTEQNIKNLNEVILVRPFWKPAITTDGQETRRQIKVGDYKEHPNSVRLPNGELFHYATPTDTPILMKELMEWYREEQHTVHPVTLAAMFHYKFVRIHPFDDGNGRLARLLMNYVLLRSDLPPVVIKSEDKNNYLNVLHLADVGDYASFIEYIAEQLIWSLELSVRATKGESVEESGDLRKEIELLSKRLTSDNRVSKHPAAVYETFKFCKDKVWGSVRQSLKQFDSIFAEGHESRYIDHGEEIHEKKSIFESPFMKSTAPAKVKIFGKDVYDDIEKLEWKYVLYGLKGAKKDGDVEITTEIDFRIDKYSLKVQLGYKSIFQAQYHYGEQMMSSDIENMNNALTKQLLEEIKERTGINE